MAPKHARKHETRPPRVKQTNRQRKQNKQNQFRLGWNNFGFILCWRKQRGQK